MNLFLFDYLRVEDYCSVAKAIMLEAHKIDKHYKFIREAKLLYRTSFPKSERDPIKHLLEHRKDGVFFLGFEDENKFIGFAFLMCDKSIAHLLFYAINPLYRNQGYGNLGLTLLHHFKEDRTLIVDVEDIDENSSNEEEREKRINFYIHHGFVDCNIHYTWNGVKYKILSYEKSVSVFEFDQFWKHFEFEEDMGKFLFETFKTKTYIK